MKLEVLPDQFERLIARRRAIGADHYDEVWNGVYVMAPDAGNEHQSLAGDLNFVFKWIVRSLGAGQSFQGCNVSDDPVNWTKSFRVPDVAVFLDSGSASDCGTHWFGGPDLAVEIVSPNDRSRRKASFYSKVGVRELWVIDRDPWQLEVYRRAGKTLRLAAVSSLDQSMTIKSIVLPLTMRIAAGTVRPQLVLDRTDAPGSWTL